MKLISSSGLIGLCAILVSAAVGWSVGRNEIAKHPSMSAGAAEAPRLASSLPPPSAPIGAADPSPAPSPPAPRSSDSRSQAAPVKATVLPRPATPPVPQAVTATSPPPAQLAKTEPELNLTPAPTQQPSQPGRGVLIVVSLPSQRAFVFKDGMPWGSSRVSTGKRGKPTPVGRFTILEKRLMHRSTKYSNAPMPYMQRITWQGVALHAGHVPGFPASHGCIRLPRGFAKSLYALTNNSSVVVVTSRRADSAKEARKLS